MITIKSEYFIRGNFNDKFDQDVVKNEPMLFNCDNKAAYDLGGPLTREFIDNLPDDWKESRFVADSRVHMLKPGWLPVIGGIHLDDIPRDPKLNGQPNMVNPPYRSNHIMGLVNGVISPTHFIVGEMELEIPPPDKITYEVWNLEVRKLLLDGKLKSYFAESGKYIQFDDRCFHEGTISRADGWRWFIRLSRDTDRVNKCTNEIRKQVQVYLDISKGW